MEYHEWIQKFEECDPDYIVDVLGITSQELIDAFEWKAEQFYLEEWGGV